MTPSASEALTDLRAEELGLENALFADQAIIDANRSPSQVAQARERINRRTAALIAVRAKIAGLQRHPLDGRIPPSFA